MQLGPSDGGIHTGMSPAESVRQWVQSGAAAGKRSIRSEVRNFEDGGVPPRNSVSVSTRRGSRREAERSAHEVEAGDRRAARTSFVASRRSGAQLPARGVVAPHTGRSPRSGSNRSRARTRPSARRGSSPRRPRRGRRSIDGYIHRNRSTGSHSRRPGRLPSTRGRPSSRRRRRLSDAVSCSRRFARSSSGIAFIIHCNHFGVSCNSMRRGMQRAWNKRHTTRC